MNARKNLLRRRPFSSVAVLILLLIAALIWPYRVQLQVFPSIISAYTAKEYCSCRFVVNNPVDYCLRYVKQWLPGSVIEDLAGKRVTATGMGQSSSAAWQGQRQGCRLQGPVP